MPLLELTHGVSKKTCRARRVGCGFHGGVGVSGRGYNKIMDVNSTTAIVKMLDALRLATLFAYSRSDDTGDRKAAEAYEALSLIRESTKRQGSPARVPGSPPPPPDDIDPGRGIRPH